MGGKGSKATKNDASNSGVSEDEILAVGDQQQESPPLAVEAQNSHSVSAEVNAGFRSAGIKIKTFRDKKKVQGSKREHLAHTLKGTVRSRRGRVRQGLDNEPILKELIQLPDGEDLDDWLAVNTIHFFNIASMVYGTCLEYCTEESCPTMSAGAKFEYLWAGIAYVLKV